MNPEIKNLFAQSIDLTDAVRSVLDEAERSPTVVQRFDGNDELKWARAIDASAVRSVPLASGSSTVMATAGADGSVVSRSLNIMQSGRTSLSAGIFGQSRVARAGTRVIAMPESEKFSSSDDDVRMVQVPAEFRVHSAARFVQAPIDTNIELSDIPVKVAKVLDWQDSHNYGVAFDIPRSAFRANTYELIAAEVTAALTLGVARVADVSMLSALTASSLATFSLAGVAAQDLQINDLRAIIGTAANGASIDANGVLRAAGIAGDLTADMQGTIVGAWNRTALLTTSDIRLCAIHQGVNGRMRIVAFIGVQSLVPDVGAFWTVAP